MGQVQEEPEMLQSCEDRQGVLLELEKLLDDSLKVPPDEKRITELRESLKETDMQQKHVIDAGRTEGVFNDLRKIVAGNQDFVEGAMFHTESACLRRVAFLFDHLKSFIQEVRVAERILSGTQRCGFPPSGNLC